MRKLTATLLITALPVFTLGQEPTQAPPPAAAAPAASSADSPAPEQPPPQYPPQYTPPPEYTPAPAPEYAPPPPQGQYAPPPHQPASPQYAPPQPPAQPARALRQRDSWYIGFGLGVGDGRAHFSDGDADFADMVYSGRTPYAFNIRAGATLTPRLLLGFDGGFVGSSAEEGSLSSTVQANYYDVGVMFFPAERGFFLRGATGLSVITQDVEGLGSGSARGVNVLGGVGYALWLGRSFNLTFNVDLQRHWFDDEDLKGATTWGGWVGFDWY